MAPACLLPSAVEPAWVMEDLLLADMAATVVVGGVASSIDGWIAEWVAISAEYKRQNDQASAKRCDDAAVMLRYFQRGGQVDIAAVLP